MSEARFFNGTTAWLHINEGNIAHSFQSLVCFLNWLGNESSSYPGPFDHVVLPNLRHPIWMMTPIVAFVHLLQEAQGTPAITFHQSQQPDGMLWRHHAEMHCFERLAVMSNSPRACGFHSSDGNLRLILQKFKRVLFRLNNLRERQPGSCLQTALLYTRRDQNARTWLNPEQTAELLEAMGMRVRVLHQMPATSAHQAELFNSEDIIVMPHGAAAYNAIFLHSQAYFFELGGTWWGHQMAHAYPAGHWVQLVNTDPVLTFNASIHRSANPGELPFHLSNNQSERIANIVRPHICARTRIQPIQTRTSP